MTLDGLSYNASSCYPTSKTRSCRRSWRWTSCTTAFAAKRLKRRYAQFGHAKASTGRRLTPAPAFPSFLHAIIEKANAHHPRDTVFDQCIITHYPPGAGIGWHTDAAGVADCIIAVSLGGPARLQFRENGTTNVTAEIVVLPGSLYAMTGPARWSYQHQVVPVKTDRYSLTFRHVRT